MAIFKGSRYVKTPLYSRDGEYVFKIRKRFDFDISNSLLYEFTEGDTLDGLARRFYGDSQLWWVLLEANSKYRTEIDIEYGDIVIIPRYSEVVRAIE